MNTKGISPLIATVLLIGFTVALAAVVMTWGLDYIRGTTENVGSKTEQALTCAGELDFEITNVDCAANTIRVQNNGAVNIANITLRVFLTNGDAQPVMMGGIGSLGVKTYDVSTAGLSMAGAVKVDAAAYILGSNNQLILCKDQIEEFAVTCP